MYVSAHYFTLAIHHSSHSTLKHTFSTHLSIIRVDCWHLPTLERIRGFQRIRGFLNGMRYINRNPRFTYLLTYLLPDCLHGLLYCFRRHRISDVSARGPPVCNVCHTRAPAKAVGRNETPFGRDNRVAQVTLYYKGTRPPIAKLLCLCCIGLSRYIAITNLPFIAVFVEYLRQFLIDLNQIYKHSSVPKNTSPWIFWAF